MSRGTFILYCLIVSMILFEAVSKVNAQNTSDIAQDASPAFSVTITPENPSIKVGSIIWVDATVRNLSDHAISLYSTHEKSGFEYSIDVRDDKSAMVPKNKLGKELSGEALPPETGKQPDIILFSGGYRALGVGQFVTDRVNVSRLYDITVPGTYSIQFLRFDDESKTMVKSNVTHVVIAN